MLLNTGTLFPFSQLQSRIYTKYSLLTDVVTLGEVHFHWSTQVQFCLKEREKHVSIQNIVKQHAQTCMYVYMYATINFYVLQDQMYY